MNQKLIAVISLAAMTAAYLRVGRARPHGREPGGRAGNPAGWARLPQEPDRVHRAPRPDPGHMAELHRALLADLEDANHSWYTEGFDFIPEPPNSRTEFILRVYDEYLRVKAADPERAKLLNIRYTGLQAYSIMEG